MSNLENLTKKILEDARKEASLILEEAEGKSNALIRSRIEEATEKKNKMIEKAENEASMIKERLISSAELIRRDKKLTAKQQLMDIIFNAAKDKLKNLNEEDYVKFLTSSLKDLNLKGTEVIFVPERIKDKISSIGLYPSVSSDENIESGFIIKDKDIVLNYEFDALVDFYREDLESEIAKELFGEE